MGNPRDGAGIQIEWEPHGTVLLGFTKKPNFASSHLLMIGLYHNLRHLGKILRVLCGISYGRDVKPAFRIKGGSIYELY